MSESVDLRSFVVAADETVAFLMRQPHIVEIAVPRPWRERLFSRPWVPHHNVVVFRGPAMAIRTGLWSATIGLRGAGPLERFTARRP